MSAILGPATCADLKCETTVALNDKADNKLKWTYYQALSKSPKRANSNYRKNVSAEQLFVHRSLAWRGL